MDLGGPYFQPHPYLSLKSTIIGRKANWFQTTKQFMIESSHHIQHRYWSTVHYSVYTMQWNVEILTSYRIIPNQHISTDLRQWSSPRHQLAFLGKLPPDFRRIPPWDFIMGKAEKKGDSFPWIFLFQTSTSPQFPSTNTINPMTFTGEVNRFNFSLQVIQDTGMPHSSWRKSHRTKSSRVESICRVYGHAIQGSQWP